MLTIRRNDAVSKQVDQVALHIPRRSHLAPQGQRAPCAPAPNVKSNSGDLLRTRRLFGVMEPQRLRVGEYGLLFLGSEVVQGGEQLSFDAHAGYLYDGVLISCSGSTS